MIDTTIPEQLQDHVQKLQDLQVVESLWGQWWVIALLLIFSSLFLSGVIMLVGLDDEGEGASGYLLSIGFLGILALGVPLFLSDNEYQEAQADRESIMQDIMQDTHAYIEQEVDAQEIRYGNPYDRYSLEDLFEYTPRMQSWIEDFVQSPLDGSARVRVLDDEENIREFFLNYDTETAEIRMKEHPIE